MDECHTFGKCVFDLKINLGHSDLYFTIQRFFFFCSEKHFSFISKAQFRRATLSCDSAYLCWAPYVTGVKILITFCTGWRSNLRPSTLKSSTLPRRYKKPACTARQDKCVLYLTLLHIPPPVLDSSPNLNLSFHEPIYQIWMCSEPIRWGY